MQPFDSGVFDKRYNDVFSIAIKDAGLEPYRVDKDPKVSIPIQDIEAGISDSRICFAEITLDNPNVWFELGLAIAKNKDVVIVCSAERTTKFPFDIQHRSIIKYEVSSSSDFDKLKIQITAKIKAYLEKENPLSKIKEYLAENPNSKELKQREIICLAVMAENMEHPESNVSPYQIKKDMERSGCTKVAATLSIKCLLDKGFISEDETEEWHGEPCLTYKFTNMGWAWVLENEQKFLLIVTDNKMNSIDEFEDIPF